MLFRRCITRRNENAYRDKPFWTKGMSLTQPKRIPSSRTSSFALHIEGLIRQPFGAKLVKKIERQYKNQTDLTPRPFCIPLNDLTYAFSDIPLIRIAFCLSNSTSNLQPNPPITYFNYRRKYSNDGPNIWYAYLQYLDAAISKHMMALAISPYIKNSIS